MPTVAVVDYGLGNVKSMLSALGRVGAHAELCSDPQSLDAYDGIVLPGVGAFPHGMSVLKKQGWVEPILHYASSGKPMLGVCLGMQMLLSQGEEFGLTEGLNIIPGKVERLRRLEQSDAKLPNIGWRPIYFNEGFASIFQNIDPGVDVYFVHGYSAMPSNEEATLCSSSFDSGEFCAGVKSGNVYGLQFHPEKSGEVGLQILKNFIGVCRDYND